MYKELAKIKEIYDKGQNVIGYLKEKENRKINSFEDIMISYDFQAGTYVKDYYNNQNNEIWLNYYEKIAQVLNKYLRTLDEAVIFDAGCGEATTLETVYDKLDKSIIKSVYGLDASFSRLMSAEKFLKEKNFNLVMGNMLSMPICDNACDIVFTVHACEPNGGNEEELLKELLRVTNKYLILFEPAYDLAGAEARERMEKHGYAIKLYDVICDMKCKVIEHRLLGVSLNELNPTGITVIEKEDIQAHKEETVLADPIVKKPVVQSADAVYCKDSMLLYPIIDGIYCMCENNAIIATKYEEFK